MRKRTLLVALIIAMCLILGLTVFVRSVLLKGKEEVVTLTVWESQKSILHVPLYVALEQDFFNQQVVRVKLVRGNNAPDDDQKVTPNADLMLTDPATYLYQKALEPSLPVTVAVVAGREGTFLLAREKEDFAWSNLKDKKVISLPPETGPGLALDLKLRENELTPFHDVGLYSRIPEDLRLGAFKAGSGDYIQLAGLQAVTAEMEGTGVLVTPVGSDAELYPAVICTASQEIIKAKPQAVQEFVNGLYKAQLYLEKEPDMGREAIKRHLDQEDRQAGTAVLEKYVIMGMWQPRPWMETEDFDRITEGMGVSGQLPVAVSYNDTVNNAFAYRAAETVQYIPPEEREKNWLQKLFS